jgi:hypothetical protein
MVTVPALNPDKVAPIATLATVASEEDQVTPDLGVQSEAEFPSQIEDVPVIVGAAFTFKVNVCAELEQPDAFFAVKVPVYVPEAKVPGMLIVIGLAVKAPSVKSVNPAVFAVAFQSILYVVGVPVEV